MRQFPDSRLTSKKCLFNLGMGLRNQRGRNFGILYGYKIGGMRSYLGIPESLDKSKIQVFSFILERLNNRVNGWTFKFFTKEGKEVIIKSVVTALPNHVMTCFIILETVTKNLTSATA